MIPPFTRSIAATSAALLLALAAPARAQNADAEALFATADELIAQGKLDEACEAFDASNRIESRAGTLIRLAECRERQGRLASAWSAYKDALTRVRDPRKREIAQAALTGLEPRLSYLTVSVADEARVDGLVILRNGVELDPGLWNRAIPVDGGTYAIGGRAPGHEEWITTAVVPPAEGRVAVEVPRFKELVTLVPAPGHARPAAEEREVAGAIDRPAPGMFTGKRKLALGLAGGGLLALVGGAVLGTQASGLEAEAFALCPDSGAACDDAAAANDRLARARSRALVADVAYGLGAAAIVGATVLWFTGAPPRPTSVAVAPHIRPGYAGLAMQVRF